MRASLVLVCAAIVLVSLSGCASKPPRSLTNDAYVWQRNWNDALLTAARESASIIRVWRVLAAEAETKTGLTEFAVNRQALRQMANPVVAVVRIDGRSDPALLGDKLVAESVALASDWRKDGVPVQGIEIDYDCGTNRLARYRDFLRLLRTRMPRDLQLSITALPSWLGSGDLPNLLADVDETVLQVHSVMSSQNGLFDRTRAYKWAQAWSAITPVPFRLALPTYWSRVTWNEDGRVVSIESESPRYGTDPTSRELLVEPNQVASLVAGLRRAPPRNLAGIAWFRLPTSEDRRAWSLVTWRAVLSGHSLRNLSPTVSFRTDNAGATDVYLRNQGGLDVKFPSVVSVSGQACGYADALPPYNLERQTNVVKFVLSGDDLLRSREERLIGWIRCSNSTLEAHVSF